MMNQQSSQQKLQSANTTSRKSKSPMRRSPLRRRSPHKQASSAVNEGSYAGSSGITPYHQVNDVRCFVHKTNPQQQASPTFKHGSPTGPFPPSSGKKQSISSKKDNHTNNMLKQGQNQHQMAGGTSSRVKRPSITSAKKNAGNTNSNGEAQQQAASMIAPSRRAAPSKALPHHQRRPKNNAANTSQVATSSATKNQEESRASLLTMEDCKQMMVDMPEADSANLLTPADESVIQPVDQSKLHGLQRDQLELGMLRDRKDKHKQLESKTTNIFARKSLTFREHALTADARQLQPEEKKKPQDFQIQIKEESMMSVEEPMATGGDEVIEESQSQEECNSPETLLTQIGIEETNIKTIGVSGTKPKVQTGSLTERQSHLLMLSQGSSAQKTTNKLVGTTARDQDINVLPPSRRFEKAVKGITRAGTVDDRGLQTGVNNLAGLQSSAVVGRRSLANSQERGSYISGLLNTQVTPFQQQSLINVDSELTNSDFTSKMQKLRNLDKIDLSQNKITKIPYPELLNHQQTLTQLCLDSNKIAEIAEEVLRQVPFLTTLKLRANQLSRLPDSLFLLAHLRVLDVSQNRLSVLSAKVSLLRQLRLLNIADNKLEGIPNSIGYLDHIETLTSEFFVYLEDQSSTHHSNNIQNCSSHLTVLAAVGAGGGGASAEAASQQQPTTIATQAGGGDSGRRGDPDLDWTVTRHSQRQTIAKNGADARFEKLMRFLRLQIEVTSTFLSLVHEFQHMDGDYYRMLDSEPVLPTEESEDFGIQHVPSFSQNQSASQIFGSSNFADQNANMTPANLLTLSKFLPREEYNQLVTVFRTLEPDPSKGNATMIHTLISNNHGHLLKQYNSGIQDYLQNSLAQLKSHETTQLLAANHQKASTKSEQQVQQQLTQQGLVRGLQLSFANKLRQAVNQANERGQCPLDLVLHGSQVETAEIFILHFGKHIELDCTTGIARTPRSEIRIIVPGNQQNTHSESFDRANMSRSKLHPIVITLTNGRFQLASKLIDVALDCYFKRKAEDRWRTQQDSFLKDPTASQESLVLSSAVMNHAALQGQHRQDFQTQFSLNLGDSEVGMTFLHHLFSNYDLNPEKAANLFRKMNSLHLRPSAQAGIFSPGELTSFSLMRSQGVGGRTSPTSLRSKMRSDHRQIDLDSGAAAALEPSSKFFASAKKFSQPTSSLFTGQLYNRGSGSPLQQYDPNRRSPPKSLSQEIKPLELNLITHYYETPFDLAIEHFQNQAVQFALNWNYNHLQSVQFAQARAQRSKSASRTQHYNYGSANSARKGIENEPTIKEFFDIMTQNNPRKLTPLHRTVICGNFNALKLMLDSPLCSQASTLGQTLARDLKNCTLIDLHAQDKFGKTARDYSHKIVFMSKLLNQAYTRQVWRQANLKQVSAQFRQLESKNRVANTETSHKNSVLATYDKLISHVQRHKPQTANLMISNGGSLIPIRHTCLNTVFLKANDRRRVGLFNRPQLLLQKHNGLASFQFPTAPSAQTSARSHGATAENRRLAKSFAALGSTPVQKHQTPFQVKTATGVILTPSLLIQKQKLEQQQQAMFQNTMNSAGVHRQSVPTSTKGIKKAKSMAFNSLTNRLDRDSQAKQFLNQAMQTHKKLMKTKQLHRGSNHLGGSTVGNSDQVKPSGSQSHLAIHPRLSKQVSTGSIKMPGTQTMKAKEESQDMIESSSNNRFGGKTTSMLSIRENKQNYHLLQQSMERDAGTCGEGEVSLGSVEVIDSGGSNKKQRFNRRRAPQQPYKSTNSPTKFQIASSGKGVGGLGKSPKDTATHHHHHNQLLRSVKVDKKLDQSLLTLAKDEQMNSKGTPDSAARAQLNLKGATPAAAEIQSDALQLADLDVTGIKNQCGGEASSLELTHDFDDCGSANSFTPLPSIQNDYALEIKSFNNQWKKPYSQQLSTNVFKEQFDLIMDNQCDVTIVEDADFNFDSRHQPDRRGTAKHPLQHEGKALKPHQKIQILFDIVRAANHPDRLQDAKDIFDFIQYEIGTQTSQIAANRMQKEASDTIAKPNSVAAKCAALKQEDDLNSSKGTSPAKAQHRMNNQGTTINNKLKKQETSQPAAKASSSWPLSNEDIVFLRQEVSYLRCQLDLMAKQMIAIPNSSHREETRAQGGVANLTQTSQYEMDEAAAGLDINEAVVYPTHGHRHAHVKQGHLRQTAHRQEMRGDDVADEMVTQFSPTGTRQDDDQTSCEQRRQSQLSPQQPLWTQQSHEQSPNVYSSSQQKTQRIGSCERYAVADFVAVEGGLAKPGSQLPNNTATDMIDVTHLTEADQELSDDFDENINTVKQPPKKQQKSRLVKPSDMLGASGTSSKLPGHYRSSNKKSQLIAPPADGYSAASATSASHRLGNLLVGGTSARKERPQKLKSNGVKMRSLKQLDKSLRLANKDKSSPRENLETDEGQTVINQPLVSAELQSFSDRLSQHRDSANTSHHLRMKRQKDGALAAHKKQSLLEMASRHTVKLNHPGLTHRDRTPIVAARKSDLVNTDSAGSTNGGGADKQPKLKYAAFAQIDLSSFDFQKKHSSIGGSKGKNEAMQEKSRSVLAIPKNLTYGSNAAGNAASSQLRSITRMSDQLETKSQNVGMKRCSDLDNSVANVNQQYGVVMQTEERQIDSHFMMIQEEDQPFPLRSGQNSKKNSTVLTRADSFKQFAQKPSNQLTQKRKTIPNSRKPLTNLGTLTSQKISLKVLHEYQRNNANRSSNPTITPSSQKSASDLKYSSMHQQQAQQLQQSDRATAAQPLLAMTFNKAQSKLSQLTVNAISLPPQTAKSGPTHLRMHGEARQIGSGTSTTTNKNSYSNIKSNYLQPKVVKNEKPNQKLVMSTKNAKSKALVQTGPHISRNQAMSSSTSQYGQLSTGVAPTKTHDASHQQLKIRPHHRLLRDLIENPMVPPNTAAQTQALGPQNTTARPQTKTNHANKH